MLLAIENNKAKSVLDNYFSMLAETGYVKRPVIQRFLAWLFLIDFVELVYDQLTDSDYNTINDALLCLFSTGCCLLPYNAIIQRSRSNITISESAYMGTFEIRATEQEMWRIAENNDFRIPDE